MIGSYKKNVSKMMQVKFFVDVAVHNVKTIGKRYEKQ